MKIYHNPRCSKSRQTLALLKENGIEPDVVLYLDNIMTANELRELLAKLDIRPMQLVRKGEVVWKEKYKGCLLYTSPSPRDYAASRMPSSA